MERNYKVINMNQKKWKIIEDFVLNDGRFNSEDFEEFLEQINK